ncbi:MAG: RNA chaperone Hfq [Terracidiphilus sp.]|jgi:sRNA-binding regulator protein Hfq
MTANSTQSRTQASLRNRPASIVPFRLAAFGYGQNHEQDPPQQQAELFYLQKQIQAQTPMVVVLEDGEQVEGCIEWYDRSSLKLRGRQKTLVYKSAIKYMYKLGDQGQ